MTLYSPAKKLEKENLNYSVVIGENFSVSSLKSNIVESLWTDILQTKTK